MRSLAAVAAAMVGLFGAPALADEVWSTLLGDVAWETDVGDTAVFVMEAPAGGARRIYVPGLAADVGGGRGSYEGYWIDSNAAATASTCAVSMMDPMRTLSPNWGRVTITFVEDGFPSDWTGLWGDCFDAPSRVLNGTARVGG